MASSSSHQENQEFNAFSGKRRMVCESSRLFDVFINHRGPDVKQTIAIQLYNSLEQLGIRAFVDSQEKQLGDSFPSTIETAICSALVHVAIFSKGYADSPWCLAELVLMLESQAKIIPVFYGVKPCELRHIEKGVYADAFIKYEEKGRYLEKLNEWKEALQSLSLIAGEEFNSFSDCHCQKIVAAVQKEVQRKTLLHVAQYPVGLNNLVKHFERRCLRELVLDFENQSGLKDKAKVVGIFGMGGSGKTTLAKELFNRRSSNYSRTSFLFDVREASERRELPSLQLKLLKDLFHRHDLSFTSIEEGTSYLKDSLQRSPAHLSFLIVIDDINQAEQLNALLIMDILSKLGNSLVIVTTRDVGVLISAGITNGYRLKGMDRNNGSELFCWHAFDQPNPFTGYEELVNSFVHVCGGLPLSLQVLGRHVHGRSEDYWRSELIEVRKTLPRDVKRRLRISFDALNAEEKQVFMDIACFSGSRWQSIAEEVWKLSGWNAQHALETLRDKCLVQKSIIYMRMHDHLRDLGREMALEFGPLHRLWRTQDLKYLELKGLRNILTKTNVRCSHSIFDKSMNSQVTFFLGQSDICVETSASLLWLELESNYTEQSIKSIPSWIPLQSLQCLKIKRGPFQTLWENCMQAPSQLKNLDITDCKHLKSLAGISYLAKLVELNISQCPDLHELSLGHLMERITIVDCKHLKRVSGIPDHGNIVELNVNDCTELAAPEYLNSWCPASGLSIRKCPELEELMLAHLSCLETITIEHCNHLKRVSLSGLNCLESIAFDINVKLKYFLLDGCQILETINFGYEELLEFCIRGCPKLEELPDFSGLSCVERIIIDGCGKRKYLQLYSCLNLRRLSGNLEVTRLYISDCPELEELPCLSSLNCLEKFEIESCKKLQNITLPTTLISLSIRSCRDLQRLEGTDYLKKLTELYIEKCPELELPSVSKLSCLEKIVFDYCRKLQNIMLPATLISLSIQSCRFLRRVAGTGDFTKLTKLYIENCPELKYLQVYGCSNLGSVSGNLEATRLYISDCPKLEELSSLSSLNCLEKIEIDSCEKLRIIRLPTTLINLSIQSCRGLRRVAGTSDLTKLTKLYIAKCPELEELPNLSNLNFLEKIEIYYCKKLQNVTLPTTLISLSIQSCRALGRVAGTGDLTELKELHIAKCPELELPSLSSLSFLEQIVIDSCEKVENVACIEELHALKSMQLFYCSNAAIRNCIPRLKTLRSDCTLVIGRAVHGAESTLNKYLFYDAKISAKAVTDIVNFGGGIYRIGTLIACYVVVIDIFTSVEDINDSLPPGPSAYDKRLELRHGEWIITMVDNSRYYNDYFRKIGEILWSFAIMKKGFLVQVEKYEEWKGVQVLCNIVDRLYH